MSDLREALDSIGDTDDDFWTKRHMVEALANDLAWDTGTEKELDAAMVH